MQALKSALTVVRRPYRAAGRFTGLRQAYSWLRAQRSRERPPGGASLEESLFPGFSPAAGLRDLMKDGVHLGLSLSPELVHEIRQFAETAPCRALGIARAFRYGEVMAGALGEGEPVAVADVCEPGACAAIAAIRQDPKLVVATSAFLGYTSDRVEARLFWSIAAALPENLRRTLGQTVDLHYDLPWFNAIGVYFYLTPADRLSGAHVLVPGSAGSMPLGLRLSSSVPRRAAIYDRYGGNCELTVEGEAGFGFLVDPYGLHKSLPPVTRDCLMLQLHYC